MEELVLGGRDLPFWTPRPEDMKKDTVIKHIADLKLPCLPGDCEKPSLLLHNLGHATVDQRRIDQVFIRNKKKHRSAYSEISFSVCLNDPPISSCSLLINAPGSGKTRLVSEGLCVDWGLYLASHVDPALASALGSRDMEQIINELKQNPSFTEELPKRSDPNFMSGLQYNRALSGLRFSHMLLARLLLLQLYMDTMPEEEVAHMVHKRRWLTLQLVPSLLGPDSDSDVFEELTILLAGCSRKDCRTRIRTVWEEIKTRVSVVHRRKLLFCVLDEAQWAADQLLTAFRSYRVNQIETRRPVLGEMVRAWLQDLPASVRFVVTGTSVSEEAVREPVASATLKDDSLVTCSDTGGFDSEQEQRKYLKLYLPLQFVEDPKGQALINRVCYWLRGRSASSLQPQSWSLF